MIGRPDCLILASMSAWRETETRCMEDRENIARVAHEAIRAYKEARGEDAPPPWDEAPAWMHESTRAAVTARLEGPLAPPSAQHEAWLEEREATGWRYGPVKDPDGKTHPLMVPYDRLPVSERRKDALMLAVIDALCREDI